MGRVLSQLNTLLHDHHQHNAHSSCAGRLLDKDAASEQAANEGCSNPTAVPHRMRVIALPEAHQLVTNLLTVVL
jgi:hypothetical protein